VIVTHKPRPHCRAKLLDILLVCHAEVFLIHVIRQQIDDRQTLGIFLEQVRVDCRQLRKRARLSYK
jgi:hypothetical protein